MRGANVSLQGVPRYREGKGSDPAGQGEVVEAKAVGKKSRPQCHSTGLCAKRVLRGAAESEPLSADADREARLQKLEFLILFPHRDNPRKLIDRKR